MNKELLILTRDNLYSWLRRTSEETVTVEARLNVIMMSLADLCAALARDSEDD